MKHAFVGFWFLVVVAFGQVAAKSNAVVADLKMGAAIPAGFQPVAAGGNQIFGLQAGNVVILTVNPMDGTFTSAVAMTGATVTGASPNGSYWVGRADIGHGSEGYVATDSSVVGLGASLNPTAVSDSGRVAGTASNTLFYWESGQQVNGPAGYNAVSVLSGGDVLVSNGNGTGVWSGGAVADTYPDVYVRDASPSGDVVVGQSNAEGVFVSDGTTTTYGLGALNGVGTSLFGGFRVARNSLREAIVGDTATRQFAALSRVVTNSDPQWGWTQVTLVSTNGDFLVAERFLPKSRAGGPKTELRILVPSS